ncbi:MAG: hypothetical protein IIB00_08325, partial [candidate division Zixibacteria bacterium]|nr:hypothetical protein [candidate division Zixibacteria bacterium]
MADSTIVGVKIAKNTIWGTHLVLGAVNSEKIEDGTIQLQDLADMGATDGQIMKWNQSATSWITANEETGSSGWTDDGTIVRLTTIDDSVGIGTATPSAKLDVVGDVIIAGKATIGPGHTNSGAFAFVAGRNNSAPGDYSVVAGGGGGSTLDGNSTIGSYSTVSGGQGNTAEGFRSTIGGGGGNTTHAA